MDRADNFFHHALMSKIMSTFIMQRLVVGNKNQPKAALQTLKCLLSWWNRVNFAHEFLSGHTMGPLGEIWAIQTLSISNSGWCN